jgi:hypothetical protein
MKAIIRRLLGKFPDGQSIILDLTAYFRLFKLLAAAILDF